MGTLSALKVLTLKGPPRRRGQIYGQTLRPLISQGIEMWKGHLKSTGMDPGKFAHQFVQETELLDSVKKWTPDLMEEVTGIAEGSGIDFETMFVWQCTDEDWWFRLFERGLGIEGLWSSCSALGSSRDGDLPSMVAQNLDLPNHFDGLQVLLHIKGPESLNSFVFAPAGTIGMLGMNKSLGVCVNTLLCLNHAKDGLPVNFVVRGILEQSTLDDAINFLHQIKHASGQNYIIGDMDRVVDFECSGNKVSQFVPYFGSRRVYHTNHSIANDDRRTSIPQNHEELSQRSRARFGFLESQLKDTSKSITLETVQSILASHCVPLCFHNTHKPGEGCTIGSLIMILSPSPELHLALPPPCRREYQKFGF